MTAMSRPTYATFGALSEERCTAMLPHVTFAAELPADAPVSNEVADAGRETSFEPTIELGNVGSAGDATAERSDDASEQTPRFSLGEPLEPSGWRPDTSRPVDVAWATFGPAPPAPEAIVGPDDRTRVADPSKHPFRNNASLQITAPDGQLFVGTAWFIGPRTLVTAGHCVFLHEQHGRYQGWARAIRVMPGRNGASLPFPPVVSTMFHTVAGWARDKDARYDYAAIVLPTDLGEVVGWHGLGVLDDATLVGKVANISGYPGDKQGAEDGTQWQDAREILSVDSHRIHYKVDTWGGQSGSAVIVMERDRPVAVGVHAYGDSYFGNSATRITPSVHANLTAWR
jgi:glutamyl endopeptidase